MTEVGEQERMVLSDDLLHQEKKRYVKNMDHVNAENPWFVLSGNKHF